MARLDKSRAAADSKIRIVADAPSYILVSGLCPAGSAISASASPIQIVCKAVSPEGMHPSMAELDLITQGRATHQDEAVSAPLGHATATAAGAARPAVRVGDGRLALVASPDPRRLFGLSATPA